MSIKELSNVISDNFDVDTSDFSEDTLLSEFIADDIELSLLVEAISNEFGVCVTDDSAESWKSLGDVMSSLEHLTD